MIKIGPNCDLLQIGGPWIDIRPWTAICPIPTSEPPVGPGHGIVVGVGCEHRARRGIGEGAS